MVLEHKKGSLWRIIGQIILFPWGCYRKPFGGFCGDFNTLDMTKQEAIQILTAFNRWRRDNTGVCALNVTAKEIGEAIDFAIKFMQDDEGGKE